MPANQCIPLFRPGADLSVTVSADVVGKTFLQIDTGYDVPAGTLPVCKTAAGGTVFGVAVYDGKANTRVPVICGPGHVIPVTASGAIAVGDYVIAGASGRAAKGTGRGDAIGIAVNAATAAGQDVFVRLI